MPNHERPEDDRELLLRAVFQHGLTEPLTLLQLASWFGVGRNKMRSIIGHVKGVERCGSLYRVPIRTMPPAYWAARLSQICANLHDADSEEAGA